MLALHFPAGGGYQGGALHFRGQGLEEGGRLVAGEGKLELRALGLACMRSVPRAACCLMYSC